MTVNNKNLDIEKKVMQLRLLLGMTVILLIVCVAIAGYTIRYKSIELKKVKEELIVQQKIAEASRAVALQEKLNAEKQYKIAQIQTIKAERQRAIAEQQRVKAETQRKIAERERVKAEEARLMAKDAFQNLEYIKMRKLTREVIP